MKTALFGFLLSLPFACLLFCQEPKKPTPFDGVFAYAINARQLVTISKDVNESSARLLTKAVCPTHAISSAITITRINGTDGAGRSSFHYDADSEVPAGNYQTVPSGQRRRMASSTPNASGTFSPLAMTRIQKCGWLQLNGQAPRGATYCSTNQWAQS
jgi:hypothetical protein